MTASTDKLFYQKREMLAIASTQEFQISDSLFEDWKEKGLLGEASERVWPGRGSNAWWSQPQLDLFLRILAYRQQKRNPVHIGPLCKLPIHRWLYYGDAGGVNLPQVKRAMGTWMEYLQHLSEERLRRHVTELVNFYQGPNAEGKRDLIKRLTAMGMFESYPNAESVQKRFDIESLQADLDPVINANPKKAVKGPFRERIDPKTLFSTAYRLHCYALQEHKSILALPDILWEWARVINLKAFVLYLREQPFLAQDQRLGKKFPRVTVNNLLEGAGDVLLSYLGAVHLQELPTPGWPGLDPNVWQKGVLTHTLDTQIVTALLLLPNGDPLPYLRNDVTISYQNELRSFTVNFPLI